MNRKKIYLTLHREDALIQMSEITVLKTIYLTDQRGILWTRHISISMIIPWNFKYSKIAELLEENQQKFIKARPKKYQKKVEKILDDFKK